ncbi:MAG: hypothetical protein R3C18_19935 [Planctomycetaceae bacterium]
MNERTSDSRPSIGRMQHHALEQTELAAECLKRDALPAARATEELVTQRE